MQSLWQTYQRKRTLVTDRVSSLPIVILMPHSSCNCRCVMCDIWKNNDNAKQLDETDIRKLVDSLKRLHTRQVLMSGGEALLNKKFFELCLILRKQKLRITLLSTGILLAKYAHELVEHVDDVIVSLDGPEHTHDLIRNVPGAFSKLRKGIEALHSIAPHYDISARCVIQKLNFETWPEIIEAARNLGLSGISFLPADVSSGAFNRPTTGVASWPDQIVIPQSALIDLKVTIELICDQYGPMIASGYIRESKAKLRNIYEYYAALHGINRFPRKTCNAPWVSAVIEADGNVRPCFFHPAMGNIKNGSLGDLINSAESIAFRRGLKRQENEICKRCVCSLNLSPTVDPASKH